MRRSVDAALFELKYALRNLRRAPAFAALVVLTLAVGVGTNGAVYSALDRFLLGVPDGVTEPHLVKRVHQRAKSPFGPEIIGRDGFSIPEYQAIAAAAPDVRTAAIIYGKTVFGREGQASETTVDYILGDYFAVLGTRAAVGRLLTRHDVAAAAPVAVVSYDTWVRRLGGAGDVVGKTIAIGGHDFTIVGVAERGFVGLGLSAAHAWVPHGTPGSPFYRPGQAPSRFNAIATIVMRATSPAQLASAAPPMAGALREIGLMRDTASTVVFGSIARRLSTRSDREESALIGLAGATGTILFIACVNTAILVLVRAARRRRETAIRFALGISRGRLMTQVLVEAMLFATIAIAAALLASAWSGGVLANSLLPYYRDGAALNGRIVLFVIGFGALTALVAASLPAFVALNAQIADGMRAGRGTTRGYGRTLRGALLGLQATLAVLMLSGAAVFVQSLRNTLAIPTGYRADDVVLAYGGQELLRDSSAVRVARFNTLRDDLATVPGVEVAALAGIGPGAGISFAPTYYASGDTMPRMPGVTQTVSPVSAGYIEAVGTRLLRGRSFTEQDRAGAELVLLVSQSAARLYWPREEAIGQCLVLYKRSEPCRRVVGVVDDTRNRILQPLLIGVYVPLAQANTQWVAPSALVLRVAPGQASSVIRSVRARLAQAGAGAQNWSVDRLFTLLTTELRPFRLNAFIFTALAGLALIMAAIGIYGTTSYTVAELTREIGVRRALGGDNVHVGALLVRQALVPVFIGAALGLAASLALGGVSSKLLYQASPTNPGVVVSVAAVLLLVATLACVSPFLRALRVSPLTALATE